MRVYVKLGGDWKSMLEGYEELARRARPAIDQAVQETARAAAEWVSDAYAQRGAVGAYAPVPSPAAGTVIKRRLGKPAGATPASPKTERRGGLYHTGGLASSIVARRTGWARWRVQVAAGARSALSGASYARLADMFERGASFAIVITDRMRRFLMALFREAGLVQERGPGREQQKAEGKTRLVILLPRRAVWGRLRSALSDEARVGPRGGRFKRMNLSWQLNRILQTTLRKLKAEYK